MQASHVLTVNGTEYTVVRLLGKGKGGYSWLAERNGAYYTLKQIHHEPCSYYTFGDKLAAELAAYDRLSALGIPMPKMLAVDHANELIVKEYIAGDTVYDLVKADRLVPELLCQIRQLCAVLYPAGLNIDYFPTNFIPSGGTLWYIDYECNPYDPQWDFEHWGVKYWSKTPEFLAHAAGREG